MIGTDSLSKSRTVKYKRMPNLETVKIVAMVVTMAFTERLIGKLRVNSFIKSDSNQCAPFNALPESVLFDR